MTLSSQRFSCFRALLAVAACLPALRDAGAQGPYEFSLVADSATPQFSGNAFGGYPTINDDGTVAFAVDQVGAFRAEEGKAPVLVGSSSTGGVGINRLGEIIARRYIDAGGSELYKAAPDGTEKIIVRIDAEFRGFGSPHLSPTGTAAFYATKYPISPGYRGIFTSNGDGTTQMLVDNLGDFNFFGGQPTINSAGVVAFTASKDIVNNVPDEGGLYVASNGAVTTVLTASATPLRRLDASPYPWAFSEG